VSASRSHGSMLTAAAPNRARDDRRLALERAIVRVPLVRLSASGWARGGRISRAAVNMYSLAKRFVTCQRMARMPEGGFRFYGVVSGPRVFHPLGRPVRRAKSLD
jgi:hypothetical protein